MFQDVSAFIVFLITIVKLREVNKETDMHVLVGFVSFFAILSIIHCAADTGIKVKIVSKDDTGRYLAFFGDQAVLATKGEIKDGAGCSKFLIFGENTAIQQKKRYLCKKPRGNAAFVCEASTTWTIVPDDEGKFVSLRLGSSEACLTVSEATSNAIFGVALSVEACDGSDEQLFKVKRIVPVKIKTWKDR